MKFTPTLAFAAGACMFAAAAHGQNVDVEIRIENLAPQNGTFQTPVWVGMHNGEFDLFDVGSPASMELERLAEDGTVSFLMEAFMASEAGAAQGAIAAGGPLGPGDISAITVSIDPDNPQARYFSYASMVIPSNDAFVANSDPTGIEIFDREGTFTGADFFVVGNEVYDAGTEVNDEIPMNTAFFGQMMPDTGEEQNGVVELHEGFLGSFGNPEGMQSILADPMFAGGDFTLPGYPIMRITVSMPDIPLADLNETGLVDGSDLGMLLAAWGTDDEQADINNDGTVDGTDLGALLSNWSP